MYWLNMPDYRDQNRLEAHRPLPPSFTGDAPTEMVCVASVVAHIHDHAYAHHIERLMVLGNLALTAGVDPQAMTQWMWASFIDGAEWVMVPNVIGMALHADAGLMATKPYASGGAYINRMSDHCRGCRYNPKKAHRRGRMPVHHALLGLPGPQRRRARSKPPDGPTARGHAPALGPRCRPSTGNRCAASRSIPARFERSFNSRRPSARDEGAHRPASAGYPSAWSSCHSSVRRDGRPPAGALRRGVSAGSGCGAVLVDESVAGGVSLDRFDLTTHRQAVPTLVLVVRAAGAGGVRCRTPRTPRPAPGAVVRSR